MKNPGFCFFQKKKNEKTTNPVWNVSQCLAHKCDPPCVGALIRIS